MPPLRTSSALVLPMSFGRGDAASVGGASGRCGGPKRTTLAFFIQAHPPGFRLQHCWPVSQFANVDDENEPLDVNSVDP